MVDITKKQSGYLSGSDDDESDYVDKVEIKKQNIKVQRSSVSAEVFGAFNKKENFKPRYIPKKSDVVKNIENRLNLIFMFKNLDTKDKNVVIDAMELQTIKAGTYVIKQYDEGDVLYVIESGELDCYKKYENTNQEVYLKTYQQGEFFGELALLYNAPRAASIKAKTDCVLYALDRETFNHIVRDSATKRRQQYEDLLSSWSLLDSLDPYDKTKIADAFDQFTYKNGEIIIPIGSNQENLYIVNQGEVGAFDANNAQKFTYGTKDYFGEITILTKKKSPFSFIATAEETQLLIIPRQSYSNTLKQVESQLEINAVKYSNYL